MRIDAGQPRERRGVRDTAAGKTLLLVAVLVLALVASRSCAQRDLEISKERAAEIARDEIDYEPDQVQTRFVPRGFKSRPTWAVSLSTTRADGTLERVTVVVVDARTGDVVETRQQR